MKRRWIRAIAAFMAILLSVNSGLIDLNITAYAQGQQIPSSPSTLGTPSADPIESAEPEVTKEPVPSTAPSSPVPSSVPTVSSDPGASISPLPSTDPTPSSSPVTSAVPNASPSITPDAAASPDASVSPSASATPMDEEMMAGFSLRATRDIGDSRLPENYNDYVDGEAYNLTTAQDFIRLQEHSKSREFTGITFRIGNEIKEISKDYVVNNDGTTTAFSQPFTGFGSATYPFTGNFEGIYTSGDVIYKLSTPLFDYLGERATISNLTLEGQSGCNAGIAKKIVSSSDDATVSLKDITLKGTLSDSGNVGMIAADIGDDVSLTLTNVDVNMTAESFGGNAGGIAGSVGKDFQVTSTGSTIAGTVKGQAAAGGYFGTVTGSYTWDRSSTTLADGVSVVGNGGYNGQFAGKLCKAGEGDTVFTVKDSGDITLEAKVSGTGTSGGLFGVCEAGTTLKIENALTVQGTVGNNEAAAAGGLLGKIESDFTLSMKSFQNNASVVGTQASGGMFGEISSPFTMTKPSDAVININQAVGGGNGSAGGYAGKVSAGISVPALTVNTIISGANAGGILGEAAACRILIEKPSVTGTAQVHGSAAAGGIVGLVSESAVELQGQISIANINIGEADPATGSIVGKQSESLVYLADGSTQLGIDANMTTLREAGTYGGIFRNQTEGSGKLIGDGTLEKVGKINRSVSGTAENYTLAGTSDFECLAIALNSQGRFGMEAFVTGETVAGLLSGTYSVTGNADISYDKTGIVALNRNDQDNNLTYAFTGSMKGNGSNITITQTSRVTGEDVKKDSNAGLFASIGSATFENLTIDGTVANANGAGGIAYRVIGGSTVTLKNVAMKKTFNMNCSGTMGGFFALAEGGPTIDADNITLAATMGVGGQDKYSGFITTLKNGTVKLNGIKLGGSLTSTSGSSTGGFLGRTWETTKGTIQNLTVTDGTSYTSGGTFGVLLNTVTSPNASGLNNRLKLNNIKLSGLKVTPTNNTKSNCALLIQNGQNLVADIIDYSSAGCTVVTDKLGSNFDEVVGVTKNGTRSGIISLHSSTKSFPEYHYENQATGIAGTAMKNPNSMYFYDVFQKLENADGTVKVAVGAGHVLDSAEKVLLWNIIHIANGNALEVFKACYEAGSFGDETYSFSGDSGKIDLSGVSVYSTPNVNGGNLTGTNNAKLTFDGQTMSSWSLSNTDSNSQHYGLQGGLLVNPTGGLTVSGLTLSGKVANLGTNSGALVAGTLSGGGEFTNITLEDLWIAGYNKEDAAYGLMISTIPTGTVTFEGIKTAYTPKTTNNGDKAAAALIGSAGSTTEKNLILKFHNMKVADDNNTLGTGKAAHNGDVFAYASFMYQYYYTDLSDENKGYGRYLFTEEEASNQDKVTYGEELDGDTEFNDTVNGVLAYLNGSSHNKTNTDFKPYVYKGKDIEVNPKPVQIVEGCGTYEDPYVITQAKQLLTLYRYINSANLTNDGDFFDGWIVNKMGDDSEFCNTPHIDADRVTYSKTGTNDSFPTQDQLSRAYYKLEADIDLSTLTSGLYGEIARTFVGFGTAARPFVGVWYGKKSDNTNYTITLPDKSSVTQSQNCYGFIQYAKGAVIKDINIQLTADAAELEKAATVNTYGGGVIGCILGGDNIIDNVKVSGKLKLANVNQKTVAAGALVGDIKKGGLILRNIGVNNFNAFQAYWDNLTTPITAPGISFIGYGVGKVEDGFVLYEDGSATPDKTNWYWNITQNNPTTTDMKFASNYTVVNGDYLTDQTSSVTNVIDTTNSTITVTLPNEAALLAMSMAMNADALNVLPTGNGYDSCGYKNLSRCRKAKYDQIGNCTAETQDYKDAASYDNVMGYNANAASSYGYPYLYQYLGVTNDNFQNYIVNGKSILNAESKLDGKVYRTTWQLADGGTKTYNMAQYGDSFRGIGALYNVGYVGNHAYGGTFRGNFDGKNNTIQIQIERNVKDSDPTEAKRAGLFNTIFGNGTQDAMTAGTGNKYTISNFTLLGSIEGKTNLIMAGGIAACINGANVAVNAVTIGEGFNIQTGIADFGGITAIITNNATVEIIDCKVSGTDTKKVILKGYGFGGGFVGKVESAQPFNIIISSADTPAINYMELTNTYQNGGGMIGHISNGTTTVRGPDGYSSDKPTVQNVKLDSYNSAGSIIGETGQNINISKISVKELDITVRKDAGGIVGTIVPSGKYVLESIITDILVMNMKAKDLVFNNWRERNGIGGVVGSNRSSILSITNATVTGTEPSNRNDSQTYGCKLQASTEKNRQAYPNGVGGIIGHTEYKSNYGTAAKVTLTDCNVSNVYLETSGNMNFTDKIMAAGGIAGHVASDLVFDGSIKTEKCYIAAPMNSEKDLPNDIQAAGGCVGYQRTGKISGNTYAKNLTATNNIVSGKQAGGLIGAAKGELRLEQATVTGGSVQSDYMAGGLVGYFAVGSGTVFQRTSGDTRDNTVTNVTISGRSAGGAFGAWETSQTVRMENIAVSGCTIIGKPQLIGTTLASGDAGGMIGCFLNGSGSALQQIYNSKVEGNTVMCETVAETVSDEEKDKISAGGMIGRVRADSTGDLKCDGITLTNNKIGIRKSGTTDGSLVTSDGKTLAASVDMNQYTEAQKHYQVLESIAEKYGLYTGAWIGTAQSTTGQVYIMNPTATFATDALRPVVDVGRRTTDTGYDYYRKTCHIIYGATNSAEAAGNLSKMKEEADKADKAYAAGADTLNGLLEEYRLSEKQLQLFQGAYPFKVTYNSTEKELPILTYKAQEATLQIFVQEMANLMTGEAGAPATDISILAVAAQPKVWNLQTDTSINGSGNASINVTQSGNSWQFSYQSGKYDEVNLEAGTLTYTELTFTYSWLGGPSSTPHTRTFVLPVFVEEPILTQVQATIKGGKVTSVEEMRNGGITEKGLNGSAAVMANDSDYTLLLEYVYGKARLTQADASIDKIFGLLSNDGTASRSFEKGTKLLLIDVTHGNHAYYYPAEIKRDGNGNAVGADMSAAGMPANVTKVKFSEFVDSAGNQYQNQSISGLADVTDTENYKDENGNPLQNIGVEQYLLMVIKPSASDLSENYRIHTELDRTSNPGLDAKIQGDTDADILIDSIKSPEIQLEMGHTQATGSISKDGGIAAQMSFSVKADSYYWSKLQNNPNAIDGANYGKYLELKLSLKDMEKNPVKMPSGTNFAYQTGTDGAGNPVYSPYQVVTDDSAVYYYKDINQSYPIRGKDEGGNVIGLSGDDTQLVNIKLNFGNADLSQFTEDKYYVCVDLIRAAKPDDPEGSSDETDNDKWHYSTLLSALVVPQLGFAIKVEEENWDKLALNTYDESTGTHTIPFEILLDFNDIFKTGSADEQAAAKTKWAGFNYEVTYEILRKQQDGYEAIPNQDGNIVLQNFTTTADGALSDKSTGDLGTVSLVYTLTEDEIAGNIQNKKPITRKGEVSLNAQALAALSGDDLKKLTNYKVRATLRVTSAGVTSTSEVVSTTDFFIFTVTRLKTDLSSTVQ